MEETLHNEFNMFFQSKNTDREGLNLQLNSHLQQFQWEIKWFQELEEILLSLIYFPDFSLSNIEQFLSNQIKETSLFIFNEFVKQNNHPIIDNHFLWLKDHPEKIDWYELSNNSTNEALELLRTHPEKINWMSLSKNNNPEALKLLHAHPEKSLTDHPENIGWFYLFGNKNFEALDLQKTHPEKIEWYKFSGNKYDYYVEKISAFNNLNLFPRLKYFRLKNK